MPEILIDVTRLLGRFWKGRLPTGVDRVGLAYVQHYEERARAIVRLAGHGFVLPKKESEQLFEWLLEPGSRTKVAILIVKALLTGCLNQRVNGYFLFNTGHSGLERDDYSGMIRRMQVRPIFIIHDLIPITHPEYSRAGERERHIARMSNVLSLAAGIITNSQDTMYELGSFASCRNQTIPPSVVALLAPGMSFSSPGSRPIDSPYFVVLSTIEPRKNHILLLQLWRGLVERMGDLAPRLVLIGQRGWECENVADMLERCEQLKGFVFERSDCTDAELVTYLHHAQALLFPSFVEGYGMPLIEALALGTPAIVSDLPVFREVAGEIPEYVAPLDGRRWSELILEYSRTDSQCRDAQLKRIKNFKVPGWSEHFAKADALLEQLRHA